MIAIPCLKLPCFVPCQPPSLSEWLFVRCTPFSFWGPRLSSGYLCTPFSCPSNRTSLHGLLLHACTSHTLTELDTRLHFQAVDLKPAPTLCSQMCLLFLARHSFLKKLDLECPWGWGRYIRLPFVKVPDTLCILVIHVFVSPAPSLGCPQTMSAATAQGKDSAKTRRLTSLRTSPGTYTPILGFSGQLQLSSSP